VFQWSAADPQNQWSATGTNFPNVIVTDLHYDGVDRLLIAGTYGRGAWTFSLPPIPPPAPSGFTPVDFDPTHQTGIVRGVWGSGPNDVFVAARNLDASVVGLLGAPRVGIISIRHHSQAAVGLADRAAAFLRGSCLTKP
jgi:hypothetical protein